LKKIIKKNGKTINDNNYEKESDDDGDFSD
jgi:hypothetical protein